MRVVQFAFRIVRLINFTRGEPSLLASYVFPPLVINIWQRLTQHLI